MSNILIDTLKKLNFDLSEATVKSSPSYIEVRYRAEDKKLYKIIYDDFRGYYELKLIMYSELIYKSIRSHTEYESDYMVNDVKSFLTKYPQLKEKTMEQHYSFNELISIIQSINEANSTEDLAEKLEPHLGISKDELIERIRKFNKVNKFESLKSDIIKVAANNGVELIEISEDDYGCVLESKDLITQMTDDKFRLRVEVNKNGNFTVTEVHLTNEPNIESFVKYFKHW